MGKIVTIMLSLFCLSATWDVVPGTPEIKWSTDQGMKYAQESDTYGSSQIDSPDAGWHRSAADYRVPSSWPDWVQTRFNELAAYGMTDSDKSLAETWAFSPLKLSTQWMDAKADKNVGSIEVNVSDFSFFTFVMTDPSDGIIDQTFQGKAKIYGLQDDKQYRIYAWDAMGMLGKNVTAVSDKYIHTLIQQPDNLGSGRTPVMAQKVVEDPNKDLWVSVYAPIGMGANYQFVDVYSIKAEGDVRTKFRVPLTTSYVKSWLTDLLLEDDGDVTFCASEMPDAVGYVGPSYVARLKTSGQTIWEVQQDLVRPASSIQKIPQGYAYAGIDWNPTGAAWGVAAVTQYSSFCKLNVSGYTYPFIGSTWWSSGETKHTLDYGVWDMVTSSSGNSKFATLCGQYGTYTSDLTKSKGGAASGTGDNTANAFDSNVATYAAIGNGETINWTFPTNQTIYAFSLTWNLPGFPNAAVYLQGQYFNGGWVTLFEMNFNPTSTIYTQSWSFNPVTGTQFRLLYSNCLGVNCPTGDARIYTLALLGGERKPVIAQINVGRELNEGHSIWTSGTSNEWEGMNVSGTTKAEPGIFKAIAHDVRTGNFFVAGSTDLNQVDLSQNKGVVACAASSGTTQWYKTYSQASEFTDIAATEDGSFLLAGTLYSGTSVQSRQAVIMKIDKDGNVDSKFPQTFKETQGLGADGRGVIETRDGGVLLVGGSSDVASTSKPYLIKLDRFYRSCSQGDTCE